MIENENCAHAEPNPSQPRSAWTTGPRNAAGTIYKSAQSTEHLTQKLSYESVSAFCWKQSTPAQVTGDSKAWQACSPDRLHASNS